MAESVLHSNTGSVTPIPDPTELTTAALMREIASLKEVIFTRIDGLDKLVEMSKNWEDRVPVLIAQSSGHLTAVMIERFTTVEEKFHSIQTQFRERDVRVDESAKATKIAVDAALSAQEKSVAAQNESFKESIEKSERAFEKQIDSLRLALESVTASFNTLIFDVKSRLDRLEGITLGTASSNATHITSATTQQGSQANTVALIGLIVGSVIAIASLIVAFTLKA